MLEPHPNRESWGVLALMWMKAKPTKGPRSCPAGPTATLANSVQLPIQRQGKYYASLAEPDPEKRE